MVRYERFMIWYIQYGRTGNRKIIGKTHLSRYLIQRVSRQGKLTIPIPYLLMTTLKITINKNIKSVLVLVNHHFLILGGKRGGGCVNLMSGQKLFFTTNHNYVSPLNEGRHFVLVWFFLLPLLLSEACLDHNFFVFPERSMIFGLWVHDHKAVCRVP